MCRKLKKLALLVWFLSFFGFAASLIFAEMGSQSASVAEPSLKEMTESFPAKVKQAVDSGLEESAKPINVSLKEILNLIPPPSKKTSAHVSSAQEKSSQETAPALISSAPPPSSTTGKGETPLLRNTSSPPVAWTAAPTTSASNMPQTISLITFKSGSAKSEAPATIPTAGSSKSAPSKQLREKQLDRMGGAILVSSESASQPLLQTFSHQPADQPTASDLADAYKSMGADFRRSGRLTEAIQYLKEALQHDPKSPEVHFELGLAFASSGAKEKAVMHLEEALKLDPNLTSAREQLDVLRDQKTLFWQEQQNNRDVPDSVPR